MSTVFSLICLGPSFQKMTHHFLLHGSLWPTNLEKNLKPCPPFLKNHKFIGFPSNTGPGPLKIKKLPSQDSMFHWQADNCLLLMVFGVSLASKKIIRVGPPLTKLSGSAHDYHTFTRNYVHFFCSI